jgi:SH3-like domain-containing protein
MRRFFRFIGLGLALFFASSGASQALDYHSIGSERAVLYDAPSAQAKGLFVVGKYFPVEIIVNLDQWAKVRDSVGALAWVEKKHLSDLRTVVVTVPRADVRLAADRNAPLVFQAERDVALELVEIGSSGWLKVRHRDGQIGFIMASQVWGA